MSGINNILLAFFYDCFSIFLSIGGILTFVSLVLEVFINSRNSKRIVKILINVLLGTAAIFTLITMCIGLSFTKVPDIRGSDGVEAKKTIIDNHLVWSNPEGVEVQNLKDVRIEKIFPSHGTIVLKNSEVYVEICSEDNETGDRVVIPDFTNMTEEEARRFGESSGLNMEIFLYGDTNQNLSTYYIIHQSIPAASDVPKGTKIELLTSSVKKGLWVSMPNVVGMNETAAALYLVNQGIDYQIERYGTDNNVPTIEHQSVPTGALIETWTETVQLRSNSN